MSTKTYKQITEEIKKAKRLKEKKVEELEKEELDFIKSQTFTGEELLQMSVIIYKEHSYDSGYTPGLSFILERILRNR